MERKLAILQSVRETKGCPKCPSVEQVYINLEIRIKENAISGNKGKYCVFEIHTKQLNLYLFLIGLFKSI